MKFTFHNRDKFPQLGLLIDVLRVLNYEIAEPADVVFMFGEQDQLAEVAAAARKGTNVIVLYVDEIDLELEKAFFSKHVADVLQLPGSELGVILLVVNINLDDKGVYKP